MHIHEYEQYWIWGSLVLILGYIATIVYGGLGAGIQMVNARGGTVENPEKPVQSASFREPGTYRNEEGSYSVYVLAQQFAFRPGTGQAIKVPAGNEVTFYLTSPDVIHGFEVVGTNVNVMAIPGQVGQFSVRFDEPGTYGLICHEYCGAGHHLMEGRIKVVPEKKLKVK